jgi:hypothetical protein
MGWFFKEKKTGFDETARLLASQRRNANTELETRRKELELERIQMKHDLEMVKLKAEIAEYEDEDDDMLDMESHLKSLLQKGMTQRLPQAAAPIDKPPLAPQPVGVSFSDEQIAAMIKNLNPMQKLVAKRSSDETISNFIRERVPDIDQDSINRAIFMVREDL